MPYTAWSVTFGEVPTAAKWNQLGTNDAYFDSLVGSGTAWTTWAPSYANLTIGNATVVAKYQQFGKTVHYRLEIVFGNTSAMGTAPTFSLPVTATTYQTNTVIGGHAVFDASAPGTYGAVAKWATTTTALVQYLDTNGNGQNINGTSPFTWTTSDGIFMLGTYEAA